MQAAFAFAALAAVAFAADLNPVIDIQSECPRGSAVMIMQGDKVIRQKGGRKFPALSLDQCADQCKGNKNGQACGGFNFVNEVCEIFADFDPSELRAKEGAAVYQKICINSDRICASPFSFEMSPQKILVGFARHVEGNIKSVQECLEICLNSVDEKDFECESAMYYPADEECILNTEDRRDRPELLADEDKDLVLYIDNNCAGSQCYAPAITQYIKVDGYALRSAADIVLPAQSLESCAYACDKRLSNTASDFSCKSFAFNAASSECQLNDERSLPLGRDELVPATGFVYHEKKCFESPRTCRNVGAYERVPQMILVGFAAFVLENINSVTKCLDACVSPPLETGKDFVCASVMYYYMEQECILNTESRTTQPDLFIPEGEGFKVDYFDIGCPRDSEACPAGTTMTTIRSAGKALGPVSEFTQIARTEGDAADCMTACYAMSPNKCRSFNFEDGKCTHLIINSDTGVMEDKAGVDTYEMMCLEGASQVCGSKQASAFDRHFMNKREGRPTSGKMAYAGLDFCLSECLKTGCGGVNYNVKTGACEWFPAGDKFTTGKDEMWDYYESHCSASRLPVVAEPKEEKAAPRPKARKPKKPTPAPGPAGIKTICDFSGMKVQITQDKAFTGAFFVKNKYDGCKVEVKNSRTAMLDLGFPTGLQQIGGPLPPGVAPNTNGFFPQVRRVRQAEFENVVPAPSVDGPPKHPSLTPGFGPSIIRQGAVETYKTAGLAPNGSPLTAVRDVEPPTNVAPPPTLAVKDCGVSDLKNGTYSATVVVQTNNFGIPGLVTSMDHIYTVSCDYSNIMGDGAKAEAKLSIDGPAVTDIRPQGKIELSSPVMMQMLSAGGPDEEQTPMIRAEIGDMLELRWNMMAFDDSLDFFVRECTAEKGGPLSPGDQTTLKILERGCPTAAVAGRLVPHAVRTADKHTKTLNLQAFRFDGSRTVRVICQLDICSGDCVPAECEIDEKKEMSFGRKKRNVIASVEAQASTGDMIETERYKVPRKSQAMASLIIVDPVQEARMEANLRSAAMDRAANVVRPHESIVSNVLMTGVEGSVCLPRSTFLGVFLFLGALCLVQAAVVGAYATKRYSGTD